MPDSAPNLLRFAHALAEETDPIALGHFSGELTITAKPDRTLVTQADTEVEARLRKRIAQTYPSHGILGEEYGSEPGDGDSRWILDPIDGTHNFVRGIPVWATLIAVEGAGELLAAVVSAPALGLRWSAARGHGATTRVSGRERPIHVSAVAALGESQLVFSGLRTMEAAGYGAPLRDAVSRAWRDRGFGDFWGYMLVAQGSAEGMVEYGPRVWDLAAPALIIEEAGGRMSDLAGAPSHGGPGALASNGLVHDELLRIFSGGSP